MSDLQGTFESVVQKELILLDSTARNQEGILHQLIQEAKKQELIHSEEEFLSSVLKREEEISTAIGYLIAIPHGKTDTVKRPFIGFARLDREIVWGSQSDEPVRLVFLIGVPEKSAGTLHLKFISQLSRKLLDDSYREQLLSLQTTDEVYRHLESIAVH